MRQYAAIEGRLGAYRPASACDGALANLTGAALIAHAGDLADTVRPGGWLVAGGVEVAEVDEVLAALEAAGWRAGAREIEDGWVGLRLARAATSPTGSRAN